MATEQLPERNKDCAYYRNIFANLNVSSTRQRGNAPHKPILLLSVIDLITQGLITDNQIPVSDELIDTFNNYWNLLASDLSYKKGLYYPFIHLPSDKFWELEFKPGFILLPDNSNKPKTNNKLREAVQYARIDQELFDLLQDSKCRNDLIDTLIAAWFSSNQKQVEDVLQINQSFQDITQNEILKVGADDNLDQQPKTVLRKSVIRNAFFRKAVVHLYDYRCAFCRLRVMRKLNQTIVDGAHIKPFSEYFDSRINNGLSLCKNHHWAFDQGWFSVNENYRIIVASDLEEDSPHARPMRDFQGEPILLPNSEEFFPRLDALEWHRIKKFRN